MSRLPTEFELSFRRYALTSCADAGLPDEFVLFDEGDPVPSASIREEAWPEIHERRWPDGLKSLPWLPWLLGHGRHPHPKRTVVRRVSTGEPLLRLHRRQPIFNTTVGVFDARDERIGYCKSEFKGPLTPEFSLLDVRHRLVGAVRALDQHDYGFGPRDGSGDWGKLTITRDDAGAVQKCQVAASPALRDEPTKRLYLLAAALVLCQTPVLQPDAEKAASTVAPTS